MPKKAMQRMKMKEIKKKLMKKEKMIDQTQILRQIREKEAADAAVEIVSSEDEDAFEAQGDPYMDLQEDIAQGQITSHEGRKIRDEELRLQDMTFEAIEVAVEIEEVERQIMECEMGEITDTQEPNL